MIKIKGTYIYIYLPQKIANYKCVFGTGDEFFASFMHFYCKDMLSRQSLELAMTFAENKAKYAGPEAGLLTEEELIKQNVYRKYKAVKEYVMNFEELVKRRYACRNYKQRMIEIEK